MDLTLPAISVELSVVLGKTTMPVHQLLRMGRGAVIELGHIENEEVEILANNMPIARGEVVVQGDKIAVAITSKLKREDIEP
ncbi:MAG: FliM/FliN family flagellar motor switch protein [Methyloligellaceae bacterium]|nr:MAG: flagellar motor switch protein FliN [Alphaproteobacteria bacterium]